MSLAVKAVVSLAVALWVVGGLVGTPLLAESPLEAAVATGDALLARQSAEGGFRGATLNQDHSLLLQAALSLALLQLYEVSGEERFRHGGERALFPLGSYLEPPVPGSPARRVAAQGASRPRIDTTAQALLALLNWMDVSGQPRNDGTLATPRALGRYLLESQDLKDGSFSMGAAGGPPVPRAPGYSVLALARLGEMDPHCAEGSPCPWRDGALLGVGWIMAQRDLGKTFDALPKEEATPRALNFLHATVEGGHAFYLHARRVGDGILRAERSSPRQAAEWAVALAAVIRIAERSETGDQERFREGLQRRLAELEGASLDTLSLVDLRWFLAARVAAASLDTGRTPW